MSALSDPHAVAVPPPTAMLGEVHPGEGADGAAEADHLVAAPGRGEGVVEPRRGSRRGAGAARAASADPRGGRPASCAPCRWARSPFPRCARRGRIVSCRLPPPRSATTPSSFGTSSMAALAPRRASSARSARAPRCPPPGGAGPAGARGSRPRGRRPWRSRSPGGLDRGVHVSGTDAPRQPSALSSRPAAHLGGRCRAAFEPAFPRAPRTLRRGPSARPGDGPRSNPAPRGRPHHRPRTSMLPGPVPLDNSCPGRHRPRVMGTRIWPLLRFRDGDIHRLMHRYANFGSP